MKEHPADWERTVTAHNESAKVCEPLGRPVLAEARQQDRRHPILLLIRCPLTHLLSGSVDFDVSASGGDGKIFLNFLNSWQHVRPVRT